MSRLLCRNCKWCSIAIFGVISIKVQLVASVHAFNQKMENDALTRMSMKQQLQFFYVTVGENAHNGIIVSLATLYDATCAALGNGMRVLVLKVCRYNLVFARL